MWHHFVGVHGRRPLEEGAQGPAVVVVQAVLMLWNYNITPEQVTGEYDPHTASAVRSYQLDLGLALPLCRRAGSFGGGAH